MKRGWCIAPHSSRKGKSTGDEVPQTWLPGPPGKDSLLGPLRLEQPGRARGVSVGFRPWGSCSF